MFYKKNISFSSSSYYFFRIMSETIINEIPSSLNGLITEIDNTVKESGVHNEDEETWLYRSNEYLFIYLHRIFFVFFIDNNNSKNDENM
jgi:hypothetical protein